MRLGLRAEVKETDDLGPVTYLLRARSAKLEPFTRPSHEVVGPTFKAVIIVPANSPAQTPSIASCPD